MRHMQTSERTALIIVSLSSFIGPLMLSGVNVAIPDIAHDLHADAIELSWVPTAYLLASAVLLLPFGRIADMYGRRRVFLAGMLTVVVASGLAALAQSVTVLIIFRVLQGVGAAMLFATGVAILTSIFPAERRGAAIGITVATVYLGLTCGPLVGGWATHQFGWRAVFLIHLPLALLNFLLAAMLLKGEWKDDRIQSFDLRGAVLYGASIIGLMYGMSVLPSESAVLLVVMGIAGLIAFVQLEHRLESPLFDVRVFFTNRVFTFSCLAALVVYSSTFATSYLLSLYLQYIKAMTAQAAGVIMIAQPIVMAVGSPLSGRLSDRYEPRLIASAGLVLMALGLGLLALLHSDSSVPFVFGALMVVGFGFAMFSSPNVNAIMGSVDRRYLGSASASMATARVLGQMFSMAIVTLVFALLLGPVHINPEHFPELLRSIRTSFTVGAVLCAASILLSLARGNVHARDWGKESE